MVIPRSTIRTEKSLRLISCSCRKTGNGFIVLSNTEGSFISGKNIFFLTFFFLLGRSGLQNTLTVSLQKDKSVLIWHLSIWWWGFSKTGALGMWSTPLFTSLPGLHLSRVVAPIRVLCMGQIKLLGHLNCVLLLNWFVWNRTVFTSNCVNKNCVRMLNRIVWKDFFYI